MFLVGVASLAPGTGGFGFLDSLICLLAACIFVDIPIQFVLPCFTFGCRSGEILQGEMDQMVKPCQGMLPLFYELIFETVYGFLRDDVAATTANLTMRPGYEIALDGGEVE